MKDHPGTLRTVDSTGYGSPLREKYYIQMHSSQCNTFCILHFSDMIFQDFVFISRKRCSCQI